MPTTDDLLNEYNEWVKTRTPYDKHQWYDWVNQVLLPRSLQRGFYEGQGSKEKQ